MKSDLVLYFSDFDSLLEFYSSGFWASCKLQDKTYVLLEEWDFNSDTSNSYIQKCWEHKLAITSRENTAIKQTFFVDDTLENITLKVTLKGGALFKPKDGSLTPGWYVMALIVNGVFQLRLLQST